VADIPGLIEGAHRGKGLGTEFLRHIERTLVLVFLIDIASADPHEQYKVLLSELAGYSAVLADKPRCLVFSKMDLIPKGAALPEIEDKDLFRQTGVSAVSGLGIDELLRFLADKVASVRAG
jgi:GTP-binding protein